jgi:hypothetical protein
MIFISQKKLTYITNVGPSIIIIREYKIDKIVTNFDLVSYFNTNPDVSKVPSLANCDYKMGM